MPCGCNTAGYSYSRYRNHRYVYVNNMRYEKYLPALLGGVAGYLASSYVGVSPLVGAAVGVGGGYVIGMSMKDQGRRRTGGGGGSW